MRDRRSLSASSRPDGRGSGLAVRPRLTGRLKTAATGSPRKVIDNYQRVEDVLAGFAQGEIVVVTDDDDRENEGDLFVAASLCTPRRWPSSSATPLASSARRFRPRRRSACTSTRWWRRT